MDFLKRIFEVCEEYELSSSEHELLLDLAVSVTVEAKHYLLNHNLDTSDTENIKLAYKNIDAPTLEELALYIIENRGLDIEPPEEDFWSRHPNHLLKPVNWEEYYYGEGNV